MCRGKHKMRRLKKANLDCWNLCSWSRCRIICLHVFLLSDLSVCRRLLCPLPFPFLPLALPLPLLLPFGARYKLTPLPDPFVVPLPFFTPMTLLVPHLLTPVPELPLVFPTSFWISFVGATILMTALSSGSFSCLKFLPSFKHPGYCL